MNTNKLILKKSLSIICISLCGIIIVPLVGFIISIVRQTIDPESINPSRTILGQAGFASFMLSSILSIIAINKGIKALKKGYKSWILWLGIILAILMLAFWLFIFIAELIYPH